MKRETLDSITGLVTDRNLVFDFFAVFSRFEYALKRAGFHKKGKYDNVEPDWNTFSDRKCDRLLQGNDPRFQAARDYLLSEPPKKQVIKTRQLGWDTTEKGPKESNERFLLRLVRTVRNNLFHGGKYPYPFGPVADVARNSKLLESSIVVLERCLEICPTLDSLFVEVA